MALELGLAQSVEVGGEVSPYGIRPYVLVSWPVKLGEEVWLVPSAFLYLDSLEATWGRGWVSLQLLKETPGFSVGLEGYFSRPFGPALRLFLRAELDF